MSRAFRRRARVAQNRALLEFGPETDTLRAAIRQAYSNRQQSVRQARGQARGVIQSVEETIPAVRGIYDRAGNAQAQTARVLGNDLSGLGNVAGSIQAGAALERANMADQLTSAKAQALTGLTQQRIAAKSGRQWAVQQARQQFVSDIKEVLQAQQSLARRRGAFVTSEIDRLAKDAAARRISQGNLLVSAGNLAERRRANKVSEAQTQQRLDKPSSGGGGSGGGNKPKPATPLQQGAVQDGITYTLSDAKRLQSSGLTRAQAGEVLHKGAPDKGIKAANPLFQQAALDLAYMGYLSKPTRKKLRGRGIQVHKLGFKVKPPNKPKQKPVDVGPVTVPVPTTLNW